MRDSSALIRPCSLLASVLALLLYTSCSSSVSSGGTKYQRKFPRARLVPRVAEAIEKVSDTIVVPRNFNLAGLRPFLHSDLVALMLDSEILVEPGSRVLLIDDDSAKLAAIFTELGAEVTLVLSNKNKIFQTSVYLESLGIDSVEIVARSEFSKNEVLFDLIFAGEQSTFKIDMIQGYSRFLTDSGKFIFRDLEKEDTLALVTRRNNSLGMASLIPRQSSSKKIARILRGEFILSGSSGPQ